MNEDDKCLAFYAMKINDHDALFTVTAEEALEQVSIRINTCDDDAYTIERVDGIWDLVRRMGAFEDYSDEWMEDTLEVVQSMITEAKAKKKEEEKNERK